MNGQGTEPGSRDAYRLSLFHDARIRAHCGCKNACSLPRAERVSCSLFQLTLTLSTSPASRGSGPEASTVDCDCGPSAGGRAYDIWSGVHVDPQLKESRDTGLTLRHDMGGG